MLLAFVWLSALVQAVRASVRSASLAAPMPAALKSTMLAQAIALLEPFHASLGLVRSSPLMALLQWSGRALVLFPTVVGADVCSPYQYLLLSLFISVCRLPSTASDSEKRQNVVY